MGFSQENKREILVHSAIGMSEIAQIIQTQYAHIKNILLVGDLGSGKTTLVAQYLARLGADGQVSSPTFSLVNEYELSDGTEIYHMDLYRIENEEEVFEAGIHEYLDRGNLCFIEWPDLIESPSIMPYLKIKLEILPDLSRRVNFIDNIS